ncbi:CBL-interacting serine/threonine-protein kinase 16 [Datura stramonium]|uniref:CBL-interacting serine/threonine-protein kinase 16 n=1 Tax=Datura stramonium TaxID=4076 RepID=A0ABS8SPH5_DATST|nr:CBL-interacting serine/threonine-protein kinase 16 [Datura stramonium]
MEDPIDQSKQETDQLMDGARSIIFGKYEMGAIRTRNICQGEGMMSKSLRNFYHALSSTPKTSELKEVMATKQKIFVVMEYVRGGELFAGVANGKLKEDVARKYFQQLISAVDFAIAAVVFHRFEA